MMNDTALSRSTGKARVYGAAVLVVLAIGLSACSSTSGSAPTTTPASSSLSTTVVTSTVDDTVTNTAVVTSTADVTHTNRTTTTANNGNGAGGNNGGGGDNHSGSSPNPCPDPATLGAVTPNYNPQYPINAINCSGEWAVGTYEADGKNQTSGIWRNTGGNWAYQDRATVCAQADNLPDELYSQACTGN